MILKLVELYFDKLSNKQTYISPEDECEIFYDVDKLLKVWSNVVVKNCDKSFSELHKNEQIALRDIARHKPGFRIMESANVGPNFDKMIVSIILWGSTLFFKQTNAINHIYKSTKNSNPEYFHHEILVKAYLKIGDSKKALEIIDFLFNKNHVAYYYLILNYNIKTENKDFISGMKKYRFLSQASLLSLGESVNLQNINYNELLELMSVVKEKISEDISKEVKK